MERALSCRELIAFIGDYLEGDLPAVAARRFREHLDVCPDCVIYLDGYRKTGELAALAFEPDAPVPETVPEDLVKAILDVRGDG